MISLPIFDSIQQGLLAGFGTQTAIVLGLGAIGLIVLFLIGFDPIIAGLFVAAPFMLLVADQLPSYGVEAPALIIFGFGLAYALFRLFVR